MRAVIKSLSWSSVSCAVIPASMAFLHVLCSLPFLKPLLGPPCSAQQISLEITLWSPWLVLFSTTAPAPAASCANAAKPLSKLLWSGSSTIVLQLPQKLNKKPTHRLVSIDSAEVITTDAGRRMTYTSINMRQISWRHCYYSGLTESTDPSSVLFQQSKSAQFQKPTWKRTNTSLHQKHVFWRCPFTSHPPSGSPSSTRFIPGSLGSKGSLDCGLPACKPASLPKSPGWPRVQGSFTASETTGNLFHFVSGYFIF